MCKCVQKPPGSNLTCTFGSCCMVNEGESRSKRSLMSRKLHLVFTYPLFWNRQNNNVASVRAGDSSCGRQEGEMFKVFLINEIDRPRKANTHTEPSENKTVVTHCFRLFIYHFFLPNLTNATHFSFLLPV